MASRTCCRPLPLPLLLVVISAMIKEPVGQEVVPLSDDQVIDKIVA